MERRWKMMAVIGTAVFMVVYLFFYSQKGIVVHGEFLKKQNVETVSEYKGRIRGYDTRVIIERLNELNCKIRYIWADVDKEYYLELHPSDEWLQDVVIYEGETTVFSGKYNPDKNETIFKLYQNDGMPYVEGMIRVSVAGEEWVEGLDLYQVAGLYAGAEQVRGNAAFLVSGLFLLVFWLIDIWFPRFFFLMNHILSVNNPEPSDFYLVTQKISWVLIPVIAVVMLLMGLFQW